MFGRDATGVPQSQDLRREDSDGSVFYPSLNPPPPGGAVPSAGSQQGAPQQQQQGPLRAGPGSRVFRSPRRQLLSRGAAAQSSPTLLVRQRGEPGE